MLLERIEKTYSTFNLPTISMGQLLKNISQSISKPTEYINKLDIKTFKRLILEDIDRVVMVFKKGEKHDQNNYRSVCILTCLLKILETITKKLLVDYY